ncbi:MAG: cation-translocating P-type ATPase [Verrucomicrobiae bacterium]|nr:cation-translocating P-type ATPase [Verrucomicrobiae bacterium]MCX7722010.1 cation-translocating P-type ATPase [Verrucomicrobiae bacterium]MDW7980905.1 cation-translocating P-type ATPase [Verrucomicrobiales bacterium]
MRITRLLSRRELATEHEHDHLGPEGACSVCGQRFEHDHEHAPIRLWQTLVGVIFVANGFIVDWVFEQGHTVASFSAFIGAVILGYPIVLTGIKDVARGILSINELVSIAVLAAFASGDYKTAGVVAFFMLMGEIVETRTAEGARASIESLIRITPTKARRILPDGREEEVPVTELRPGDLIRIRPGDNVPADGVIVSGQGSFNQATITGESLPVDKKPGDEVFAGTQNLTGALEVKVTRAGQDTTLGRVRELILAAQKTKLPIMKIVDQYMGFYTPLVLVIGALVWAFTKDLNRVISVLVVACPCAFILATPTAMVAALSAAARLGILIKNVADIELAARINAFVFDKTRTITTGDLAVSRLAPAPDTKPAELLRIAASAEKYSNHPTAKALLALAQEVGLPLLEPKDFVETAGLGVKARVNGSTVLVGRAQWLRENGVDGDLMKSVDLNEAEGWSLIFVSRDGKCIGWIGLEDKTRPEAKEALKELKEAGVRRIAIFSGDRQAVTSRVAREIGCEEAKGDCLPQDKVEFVHSFKAKGYRVAVVGDGVNDAPALAAGDMGIAMGAAGSEVAIHTATIALMNNDLKRLPFLVRLSRSTRAVINQNFLFGVFFIIGGLTLASFGYLNPIVAAILHNAGSLIVIFNSARLVRKGEELEHFEPLPAPPAPPSQRHAAAGQLQPQPA